MKDVAPAVIARWFTEDFANRAPQTVRSFEQMLMATPAAGYAASCAAIRDCDLRPFLSAISMPALVVFGQQDPVTTEQDAQELAGLIHGSSIVGLPAAHLSNVEAAAQFNHQLANFLSREGAAANGR